VYNIEWLEYKIRNEVKGEGVTFAHISSLENCFKVNINIFKLYCDGIVESVYSSCSDHTEQFSGQTMNLNLYMNHLSLITNLSLYSRKYRCDSCDKFFSTARHLRKHVPSCQNVRKFKYPGGYFQPSVNIFEKLDLFSLKVPKEKQFYPYFIVYDFEAILKKVEEKDKCDTNLTWMNEHRLISVAICSNIPGFETPFCIVNGDEDQLVLEMFDYLEMLADTAYDLVQHRWWDVIHHLEQMVYNWSSVYEVRFFVCFRL
jgi:hypothetical protein